MTVLSSFCYFVLGFYIRAKQFLWSHKILSHLLNKLRFFLWGQLIYFLIKNFTSMICLKSVFIVRVKFLVLSLPNISKKRKKNWCLSPLTMAMCDSVINFLRGKMIYNVGMDFLPPIFVVMLKNLIKVKFMIERGHSLIEIYDNFPKNCLYNNVSRLNCREILISQCYKHQVFEVSSLSWVWRKVGICLKAEEC